MLSDLLGWLAASLVFAAFCAREMVPLRTLAIASNIAFMGYGYLDHLWPITILHAAMLPMNVWRLRQTLSVTGQAPNVCGPMVTVAPGLSLPPFERPSRRRAANHLTFNAPAKG